MKMMIEEIMCKSINGWRVMIILVRAQVVFKYQLIRGHDFDVYKFLGETINVFQLDFFLLRMFLSPRRT